MTPSETMFRELNWLHFCKRVQYSVMYKTLNNLAPEYLSERLMKISDLLKVPYSRTRYYDNLFAVTGAYMWNSLPLNIRQSPSLGGFKGRIKSHLLAINL